MVKIQMFDGIVRTLTDVIHVLGLQRNAVSLGTLDFKGHKCTIAGEIVKAIKGALFVVNGEIVKKNLYN